MPFNWVDGETVEKIIHALMPYEHEIKSERHRAMARKNRERDVVTMIRVLADCGYTLTRWRHKVRARPPLCDECRKPLEAGDYYYMTLRVPGREDEPRRVWHASCMDATYRSLSECKLYRRSDKRLAV